MCHYLSIFYPKANITKPSVENPKNDIKFGVTISAWAKEQNYTVENDTEITTLCDNIIVIDKNNTFDDATEEITTEASIGGGDCTMSITTPKTKTLTDGKLYLLFSQCVNEICKNKNWTNFAILGSICLSDLQNQLNGDSYCFSVANLIISENKPDKPHIVIDIPCTISAGDCCMCIAIKEDIYEPPLLDWKELKDGDTYFKLEMFAEFDESRSKSHAYFASLADIEKYLCNEYKLSNIDFEISSITGDTDNLITYDCVTNLNTNSDDSMFEYALVTQMVYSSRFWINTCQFYN